MPAPATAFGGEGGDRGECPQVVQPRHGGYRASEQNEDQMQSHSEQCSMSRLDWDRPDFKCAVHFQSRCQTICPHSRLRKYGIRFFNKKVGPNHRTAAESPAAREGDRQRLNSGPAADRALKTIPHPGRPGSRTQIILLLTPFPDCFLHHSCNQP